MAALSGLGIAANVQAQGTVTLSGASGNNCSYSAMSITPNGNVVVTCSGSPPPAQEPVDPNIPGTFKVTQATMTASANSTVNVGVSRRLGSQATTIWWWRGGAGCVATSGGVDFAAGAMTGNIPTAMLGSGTCEVHLAVAAPAVAEAPSSTMITVSSAAPPVTPPGGCPAVPENMISRTWPGGPGNPFGTINTPALLAASGQITSIPLPKMVAASGELVFFELAGSPDPTPIEISINKCPGVIDTDTNNRCNLRTVSRFNNKITWFEKSFSVITDTSTANDRGYCWAGDKSVDQYYINARWTYSACPFGMQVCGYGAQYNLGPY